MSLENYSDSSTLVIQNISYVTALNVNIKITSNEGKSTPLGDDDYRGKLPRNRLDPGDKISLMFSVDGTTGTTFNSICSWENPDKSKGEKETFLSV